MSGIGGRTLAMNGPLGCVIWVLKRELRGLSTNHVLKLKKSFYGLKQSGRGWHTNLKHVLEDMGLTQFIISEHCIYTKVYMVLLILLLYINDFIIASSSKKLLNCIKLATAKKFEIVDSDPLNHFLVSQFHREGQTRPVELCQKQYIKHLLNDCGMSNSKGVATPLGSGFQKVSL